MSTNVTIAVAFSVLLAPSTGGCADADFADRVKVAEVPECAVGPSLVEATPTYDAWALAQLKANPMQILKPGYANMPEHLAWDYSACLDVAKQQAGPALRAFRVDDFASIYSAQPRNPTEAWFVEDKQRILEWISNEQEFELPAQSLMMIHASPSFGALGRVVTFAGGSGRSIVIPFEIEPSLVTGLYYEFQGFSDDGELYLHLLVPLSLEGLADAPHGSHLGYSGDQIYSDKDLYEQYLRAAKGFVETHAETIMPQLNSLDRFVRSIEITATRGPENSSE